MASIEDIVGCAAKSVGRGVSDCEPFLRLLIDNWFDTPQSVAKSKAEEIASLGIPLRFAQELINAASPRRSAVSGGAGEGASQVEKGDKGKGGKGDKGKGDKGDKGASRERRPRDVPAFAARPAGAIPGPPKVIKVREYDSAFSARGSILGPRGINLNHIQDETGVRVDLRGESPMELVLSNSTSGQAMETAYRLCKQLLSAVYAEYNEWREAGHGGKGDHKGERKGDRKGDHKGDHKGDRPHKAGEDESAKGAGKSGKGKGRMMMGDCKVTHTVEVVELDEAFNVRARIIGTRGMNMKDVESRADVAVHVKGGKNDEPVTVDIGAHTQEAVDEGVTAVEELLEKVYAEFDVWTANGGQDPEPAEGEEAADAEGEAEDGKGRTRGRKRNRKGKAAGKGAGDGAGDFTEVIEVDLPRDEVFGPRGKILGRGGARIRDIQERTGARVELHCTDGHPLSLEVIASSEDSLQATTKDIQELLSQVHEEYSRFLEEGHPADAGRQARKGDKGGKGEKGGKGGKGEKGAKGVKGDKGGKGKGKEGKGKAPAIEGLYKKTLKLKDTDPSFNIQGRIRGTGCENLHHIQDETKVQVWVLGGKGGEPVRLEITGDDQKTFETAVGMAKDLVKSIFRDHDSWVRDARTEEPAYKRQRT